MGFMDRTKSEKNMSHPEFLDSMMVINREGAKNAKTFGFGTTGNCKDLISLRS